MIDALHSAWYQALALQKTPKHVLDEAQQVTHGILDQQAKDFPH